MFMCQFQGARKYPTPPSRLASIKQGPNEMLKAYIKRFNDEPTTIHNPQENGVMMVAISGVRPDTPFWDKSMLLETAQEAIQAGKPAPAENNNDNGKKRKNGDRRSSLEKTNKKPKTSDQRVLRPPPSKFVNYTDLVSLWEDVFIAAEQTGVFKRPDPLRGDRTKRNQNKYCQYYKDVNHTTEECITLKDEIEKLIHRWHLKDYINNKRTRLQNDGPEVEPPCKI